MKKKYEIRHYDRDEVWFSEGFYCIEDDNDPLSPSVYTSDEELAKKILKFLNSKVS